MTVIFVREVLVTTVHGHGKTLDEAMRHAQSYPMDDLVPLDTFMSELESSCGIEDGICFTIIYAHPKTGRMITPLNL